MKTIYILDEQMKVCGQTGVIAASKKLHSASFVDNIIYLATANHTEPIFTIDITSPTEPKVLGELQLPNSDYLLPYDSNHLIVFNKDIPRVSLFNISDVNNPVDIFGVDLGGPGSYSDVIKNNKALLFNKDKGILAFPVNVFEADATTQVNTLQYQGAYIYNINTTNGFEFIGNISHLLADTLPTDTTTAVKHILYVGDGIYTISDKGVVACNKKDIAKLYSIDFD